MPTYLIVIIAIIVTLSIPVVITLIFSRFLKKRRWIAPTFTFLIALALQLRSIFNYNSNISLLQQVIFYFKSDAAIEFPLLYLPLLISSLILTIFLLMKDIKSKR